MSVYYRPQQGRGHTVDKRGKVVSNDTIKRLQLELGAYMRQLREAKGLTQRQLAALVGVTDNHISDVENGVRKMSPERYGQFAKILGVAPADLGWRILLHYDPYTYKLLRGGKKVDEILSAVPERITEAFQDAEG